MSTHLTVLDPVAEAPALDPTKALPSVNRIFRGDGANLVVFNFAPGQELKDHKAAHPITVQCVKGTLHFTVGEETITLTGTKVVHLPAYVVHRVDCPTDAAEESNVLLLTMFTGEKA